MEKISAIIPTFNEEHNVKAAIESCLFADEIIVVDSFSTDKTLEIAREFEGVTILEHEYKYSAAQKNWTIPQAKHDWIFLLDADEVADAKLISEIKETVSSNPEEVCFWIPRKNKYMGQVINYVWKGDAVIRLFRKSKCKYEDKHVHAEIITDGKISRLKNPLYHDTYKGKGFSQQLKKGERYSTWSAYDHAKKVKKVTYYHLIVRPFLGFLKRYILNRGFLDGKVGFIISCTGAWNTFVRFVKVWRIQQGEEFKKE